MLWQVLWDCLSALGEESLEFFLFPRTGGATLGMCLRCDAGPRYLVDTRSAAHRLGLLRLTAGLRSPSIIHCTLFSHPPPPPPDHPVSSSATSPGPPRCSWLRDVAAAVGREKLLY